VLELRCVSACFGCEVNQLDSAIQVTVMIRSNVRDEVGGIVFAD
jgi:hypothetical protein